MTAAEAKNRPRLERATAALRAMPTGEARLQQLRDAARDCMNHPHTGDDPKHCALARAVPPGAGYDEATMEAVAAITGVRIAVSTVRTDLRETAQSKAIALRSYLRRWAVRDYLTGGRA